MELSNKGFNDNNNILPEKKPLILTSDSFQIISQKTVIGIKSLRKTQIYKRGDLEYCYDINGSLIFEIKDSLISFSNTEKMIFVYNKFSGEIITQNSTDYFLPSSTLYKNKILCFNRHKQICLFNYQNAKEEWRFDTHERADNFRVSKELFFYTNRKDNISCRSIKDQRLIWSFNVSEIGKHISSGEERDGKIGSSIFLYNDLLIAYIASSKIVAINQLTGEIKWHVSLNGEFATCNMDSNGFLYCLETFQKEEIKVNLYIIDARIGKVLKKKNFKNEIENTVGKEVKFMDYGGITLTDDSIFFCLLEDMLLLRINKNSFEIDWYYEHKYPINAQSVKIAKNHLIFQDQEKDVYIFKRID